MKQEKGLYGLPKRHVRQEAGIDCSLCFAELCAVPEFAEYLFERPDYFLIPLIKYRRFLFFLLFLRSKMYERQHSS